jgi:hypothetical protein
LYDTDDFEAASDCCACGAERSEWDWWMPEPAEWGWDQDEDEAWWSDWDVDVEDLTQGETSWSVGPVEVSYDSFAAKMTAAAASAALIIATVV